MLICQASNKFGHAFLLTRSRMLRYFLRGLETAGLQQTELSSFPKPSDCLSLSLCASLSLSLCQVSEHLFCYLLSSFGNLLPAHANRFAPHHPPRNPPNQTTTFPGPAEWLRGKLSPGFVHTSYQVLGTVLVIRPPENRPAQTAALVGSSPGFYPMEDHGIKHRSQGLYSYIILYYLVSKIVQIDGS